MFIRHGASLNDSPARTEPLIELSPKEYAVVQLLAEGASNKEMARRLGVAPSTINTLVNRCFEKLGAKTRTQAAVAASRSGVALVA